MSDQSKTEAFAEILKSASFDPNNLFSLLNQYRVIVPGIQRHYVQGADTVKAREVRSGFVRNILSHLKENKLLCLDYIYGPINTAGVDAFVPVDGQQRLTTIWLLARYFADSLESDKRNVLLRLLGRFTYEGRVHATRFCHAFTSAEISSFVGGEKSPSAAIKKSDWFNPYWETDETVAGMLNTLDTIYSVWKDEDKDKAKPLPSAEGCLSYMCESLTFHLCVEQFSDDIYMKMNARGLTLTQWENFKGRFSELLNKKVNENVSKDWDKRIEELSDAYYLIMKEELPDDSFFALMARIIVYESMGNISQCKDKSNSIDLSCIKNILKLARHTNADWKKELPYVPFEEFRSLLESLNPEKIAKSFLNAIAYITTSKEIASIATPYWQGDRKLVHCLFNPRNENDLDFSLCIYEYISVFEKPDFGEFQLALRLMWNILGNVIRGDEDNSYNRVDEIRTIINGAGNNESLYHDNIEVGSVAVQYLEEKTKASIYSGKNQEDIQLMQSVETRMRGRIRLGILRLNKDDVDFSRGAESFSTEPDWPHWTGSLVPMMFPSTEKILFLWWWLLHLALLRMK